MYLIFIKEIIPSRKSSICLSKRLPSSDAKNSISSILAPIIFIVRFSLALVFKSS